MAFNRDRWSRVSDAMNTGQITIDGTLYNGPAMFTYASDSDSAATIAAADYFADVVYSLAVGDYIWADGSDTNQILQVSAVDRDAGTVSTGEVGVATETRVVTVSSAELLALATTPKELVPAPGAGKFIQFVSAQFVLNYNSAAYTEAGDNLGIKYTNASGVQVSNTIEMTGFIDQTADTLTNAVSASDVIVAASGAVNQALVLDNLGSNFAAGDSPVDVIVNYKVLLSGL